MLRFSLRWLLGFVTFVAVAIVCLRYASFLISGCLAAAWLVFLMVAILGALYRRERRRAFWVGCCVFGWSFAAYGMLSSAKNAVFDQVIQSLYNTISWTAKVDSVTASTHTQEGGEAFFPGPSLPCTITFPRKLPFEHAADTLIGFIIAMVGGIVAQWFYMTRDRDDGERDKRRFP